MAIRVLLFDNNSDIRETLTLALTDVDSIDFLGSWENCANAKQIVEVYKPDVILMDIDMPVCNGIDGVKLISKEFPHIKVIMLTVFDDDSNIFNALCAGAVGYLLKKTSPEKIVDSIQDALSGGAPITSSIALKVLKFFPKNYADQEINDFQLTKREHEILQALVKGMSYKIVAAEFKISIDTVRSHIRRIYEKLHVNSATEAAHVAMKNKIFK